MDYTGGQQDGYYFDPSAAGQQHTGSYGMFDPSLYENPGYYPGSNPVVEHYYPQDEHSHAYSSAPPPEPGSYYPVDAIQTHVFGDPITAVAYDDLHAAIYVASASLSMSNGRQRFNDHKASMLLTHSTTDGMLYSSVAGHPQAPARVLNSVYQTIYGTADAKSTSSKKARAIPNHAYHPPYDGTTLNDPPTSFQKDYQMGIHTLIPVQGYVASVSPAGIRVHSHGGLQLADRHVEGMICGTAHPTNNSSHHHHHHASSSSSSDNDITTHMTVGGLALMDELTGGGNSTNTTTSKHQLLCVDLWQGLRTVASSSLDRQPDVNARIAVTALATNHSKGSVIAGCSDGQLRLFDARLRELAKVKSHAGGVVSVAVSEDGTLLATTGFGSRAMRAADSPLYGFPDPTVLVYDIRYLGRGGIPHPFAGMRQGPRFLSFVPDVEGKASNRLLIASGQPVGGLQIIQPFNESASEDTSASSFIVPQLDRGTITAMSVCEGNLALGTSKGFVLQYQLAGYKKSAQSYSARTGNTKGGIFVPRSGDGGAVKGTQTDILRSEPLIKHKQPLEMHSFEAPPPPLSLDASILRSEDPNSRPGATVHNMKPIFSTYILGRNATVSSNTSFGHLAASPMVAPSRLRVSSALLNKATHAVDFLLTVPVSDLNVDLLEDHTKSENRVNEGRWKNKNPAQPNPNKLCYSTRLFPIAYEESLNRSKKLGRKSHIRGRSGDSADEGDSIPNRYRLTIRPTHKSAAIYNHGEMNETGFIPGWDYPPSCPNAFVPPVLMLLYLMPELKSTVLTVVTGDKSPPQSSKEKSLLPELGYLFHRIDSISRYGMLYPVSFGSSFLTRVGAWAPSNFISCLTAMPEAEQLQILDGSPAAVDTPRRPEAFYRFLLYQIDKETNKSLDSLAAMDFVSINEFVSGSDPSSETVTRVMTVDLSYDSFFREGDASQSEIRFGNLLQRTLCKETRLRAWSQGSKSYETIVQRKIAASLPSILSLSCACAGRKDEEGLKLWRGNGLWLPELIEVELGDTGSVIVREFIENGDSVETGKWEECVSSEALPQSISDIMAKTSSGSSIRKRRYRLEAVLSMVRDDLDKSSPEQVDNNIVEGHHILHMRVNMDYKKHVYAEQIRELESRLVASCRGDSSDLSLLGCPDESLQQRLELAKERLQELEKCEGDEWVLLNGYVVTNTIIDDARAFHNRFKEPSLVVFRSIDQENEEAKPLIPVLGRLSVSSDVMKSISLTNGTKSPLADRQRLSVLPGRGDMIAFDAEFVSVQEEESALTESGSKVVLRETRYAVGRISLIDCRTGSVFLDDHVLPREQVANYLTRFSGIVANDLDSKNSPHHLIGTRAAMLKIRFLIERGCIFVGHGLLQDFWTLGLAIPAWQVRDTVAIYHKPAQRYISLRFLTNFVLKRDMQQDVHDSVEDAMAAYELYAKAVELKKRGEFENLLNELYDYGQKNDWKIL